MLRNEKLLGLAFFFYWISSLRTTIIGSFSLARMVTVEDA